MKYKCIEKDCNNSVSKRGNRCKSCANESERNPYWKDGVTKKQHFCKICSNEISLSSYYRNQLCKVCSHKNHIVTEETREKIAKKVSTTSKNHKVSQETRKKISEGNKGKKCLEETREKISESLKGKTSSFKNKHHTEETIEYLRKINTGKLNPGYIDGRSYFPYPSEFNNILKEKICQRDDYICQLCGMTEEEHLELYNARLTVHHIGYDKKDSREDRLITLCFKCNASVNFQRWSHFKYFMLILSEKGVNYERVEKSV